MDRRYSVVTGGPNSFLFLGDTMCAFPPDGILASGPPDVLKDVVAEMVEGLERVFPGVRSGKAGIRECITEDAGDKALEKEQRAGAPLEIRVYWRGGKEGIKPPCLVGSGMERGR